MSSARLLRWSELPIDRPMERIDRQRVIADAMMISRVQLRAGFRVPTHHHANEQIVVMLKGRCVFGLGAEGSAQRREITMVGGEVLVLPSNVPHSCEAVEDTEILDLFSPPSETTGVDQPRARAH